MIPKKDKVSVRTSLLKVWFVNPQPESIPGLLCENLHFTEITCVYLYPHERLRSMLVECPNTTFCVLCSKWIYRSLYLSWVKNLEYRSEILASVISRGGKGNCLSLRQWEVARNYNSKQPPHSLCRNMLSLALIGFTVFTHLLGK